MSEMYIACPKCDWRPDDSSKWECSCGCQWNTFETHGICPKCGQVWMMTQCLSEAYGGCGLWSDHEDWYHDEDAPSVEEYLV
ncbi:MAG: hypothetical protein ABI947_01635 [Chloroflexota bacterium]